MVELSRLVRESLTSKHQKPLENTASADKGVFLKADSIISNEAIHRLQAYSERRSSSFSCRVRVELPSESMRESLRRAATLGLQEAGAS